VSTGARNERRPTGADDERVSAGADERVSAGADERVSAGADGQPRRTGAEAEQRTASGLSPEPADRLGYLLKHAQERLRSLTSAALAPHGIDGRELAVLLTLARSEPASQQQAARQLGVDRTTMVAILDVLEGKGLVTRHPDASDRRKNVVELTPVGQDTLRAASRAGAAAERQFLAPLTEPAAQQLKQALRALLPGS
jgi:DNA-binding MarR family transcriptional regulator